MSVVAAVWTAPPIQNTIEKPRRVVRRPNRCDMGAAISAEGVSSRTVPCTHQFTSKETARLENGYDVGFQIVDVGDIAHQAKVLNEAGQGDRRTSHSRIIPK